MSSDLMHPAALLIAVAADALFGEPGWLYRRLPHPVVAIGSVIAWADRRFNRLSDTDARRRRLGILAAAGLVAGALGFGWVLQALLLALPWGPLWLGLAMS